MKPGVMKNETRVYGKPANWNDAAMGPCGGLSVEEGIHEGIGHMTSAWELEPGDLEKLAAGAPVHLRIYGNGHPVVSVYVGDPTETPQ